jgi:alkanesulfonate monooxygenase SsuD/methylene tetrahydromethanopterin reductase-like flavin-dependent oxidoreductase (luciferase family)
LGQGAIEAEFETANVPLKRRGSGMEEFVAALRAAWGPDPVSFSGRFYRIPESQIGPKPVQPGGPPIILGGRAPAAIERAARIADGYNPVGMSLEALEEGINTFRNAARAAGRDLSKLQIVVRNNGMAMEGRRPLLTGSVEQMREDVERLRDLGVDHAFLDLNFGAIPVDEQLKVMERLRKAAG